MRELLTMDRGMQDLIQLAKTVAQSKATVLIQGESGTGKELMARLVHDNSTRSGRPYVAINCAAIPETLLESELFGYERGAFTGAVNSKIGKFEQANGGTLLLDEISEMDVRLQAKLLRVIQEGQIDRIGGKRSISVDVRIIATTNKNLSECVRQGLFREDLFYRVNVVNLTVPPLRDRFGDVEVLSKYFAKMYSDKNGKSISGVSPEAVQLLISHTWPGNIRELRNVMERAVITAKLPMLQPQDILIDRVEAVSQIQQGQQQSALEDDKGNWLPGQTLNDIERNVILEALGYHNGNRTHTARALGISIRTLRNKLADYRKLGMDV